MNALKCSRLPGFKETIALTWLHYAENDDHNHTDFVSAAVGIYYFHLIGAIP